MDSFRHKPSVRICRNSRPVSQYHVKDLLTSLDFDKVNETVSQFGRDLSDFEGFFDTVTRGFIELIINEIL
jgi:hypothetical protein